MAAERKGGSRAERDVAGEGAWGDGVRRGSVVFVDRCRIAKSAADLNVRLMGWRFLPGVQPDVIRS